MKYSDPKTGTDAEVIGSVLFIKGTTEKEDIKQDLDIWPIKRLSAVGHRGAYESALWLYEVVDFTSIESIEGHSLGGAVAQWLCLMTDLKTTTYGAFNPFYWVKDNKKCKNFIRLGDLVPFIFLIRRNLGKTHYLPFITLNPHKAHMSYPLIIWRDR